MKKILTIAFSLIYLISSSGVLLGQHLCMDRVIESSLFKKVDKDCGMDMPMPEGMEDCCDDVWTLKIIEDDQQLSLGLSAPQPNYFVLYEITFTVLETSALEDTQHPFFTDQGPPDKSVPPLYLYYHNLKIPAALQS